MAHTCYGFRIGGVGLIIAPHTASEVVAPCPVYPLPSTDRWFRGLINLRGALVPVYELRVFLGNESDDNEKAMMLVLDEGEYAAGMLIDGIPVAFDAARLRPLDQPSALPEPLTSYVDTVFGYDGEVWATFEHRMFFESLRSRLAV